MWLIHPRPPSKNIGFVKTFLRPQNRRGKYMKIPLFFKDTPLLQMVDSWLYYLIILDWYFELQTFATCFLWFAIRLAASYERPFWFPWNLPFGTDWKWDIRNLIVDHSIILNWAFMYIHMYVHSVNIVMIIGIFQIDKNSWSMLRIDSP